MIDKLKTILKKIEFKHKKSSEEDKHVYLSEEQIQMIAEYAISKLRQESEQKKKVDKDSNGYFRTLDSGILEPKKKVIEQYEFSMGVRIGGIILLAICIWYWIWFFFIVQRFEPLTYSAYITLILVSLTLINKFESVLLNSITGISVYGFMMLTIGSLIVSHSNFINILTGPLLYGLIASFQLFLVFHPKIFVSKRYMIWGLLFYLLFLSSFETFTHVNVVIGGTEGKSSELQTAVLSFYILMITYIVIYFYKKKFGLLLP
ncbi:MAG: hypothetical protein EU532_09670 [Promethearchaeota archaeon]|nr:MAG: hypothetical protein EU532_09670 [Candidatus Lokiarchaeota archaeon]